MVEMRAAKSWGDVDDGWIWRWWWLKCWRGRLTFRQRVVWRMWQHIQCSYDTENTHTKYRPHDLYYSQNYLTWCQNLVFDVVLMLFDDLDHEYWWILRCHEVSMTDFRLSFSGLFWLVTSIILEHRSQNFTQMSFMLFLSKCLGQIHKKKSPNTCFEVR